MSRFLVGIFCDVERLSFSKQYLVISTKSRDRKYIEQILNFAVFLLQFWLAFESNKYHLRLDGILSFVLVTS